MAEELSLGDRKIVQTLLEQRNQESLWMGWVVKIEASMKKRERRLVVITADKVYSLKPGGKVAREGHYLELVTLQSPQPGEVNLTYKTFKLNMITNSSEDIIHAIRFAAASTFPGMPEKDRFKCDVLPASRLKELDIPEQPLGGFIGTYKSLCYFYGHEVREDICWDMENLFIPLNMKDFNLREFEQPISFNDLRSLFHALQHNMYFRTLTAKDYSFDKNVIQCIADCLKTNTKLEEITLSRSGISKEGVASLSDALNANKFMALTHINLSYNPLEDKGITSFAAYIGSMNRGLVKLNLNTCSFGKAGATALVNALRKNVHMSNTLTYFDISNNKLESEGSSGLAGWLANPNALRSLFLANTSANLEILLGAMLRGCNELQKLDIAQNKFTKKEAPILAKWITASATLANLNLSGSGVPTDTLKDIFSAIAGNLYLKDFIFNIADNKIGIAGARVIASVANTLNNIASIDLSDNDLGDEGIGIVAEGFTGNTHLKHLSLDRNYKGKTKTKSVGIDGVISLLGSECPLESLSIAGGPKTEFKQDLLPLLYAVGTNDSLKSLDISGNQLGNKGASALGKALQTNETLHTLKWDNNNTTLAGFSSFNMGLKRNFSLKVMPMPINDLSNALKEAPNSKALSDIASKIEANIARNQNPTSKFQKESTQMSEGLGSQLGFLTSGQREEMQKLLFKIKGTGRKVPDEKRIVLEDAASADQIMSNLFNIKEQSVVAVEHELRQKLIAFVQEAAPLYSKMKASLLEQIGDAVKKSFHCLDDEVIRRMQTSLQYGGAKDVTEEDFERVIVEASGVELTNKTSQAFHTTVSFASDYLYEKLQDQLRDISDELMAEITQEAIKAEEEKQKAKSSPRDKDVKQPSPRDKPVPPPQSKKPVPPSKSAKPTGKGTPTKGAKVEEVTVHVEALPKAESNLTHLTKDRAAQQPAKRPPTRKPRPAPPPSDNKM